MSKLDSLIKDFNKQYKEDIAARGIKRIETEKLAFSSPRINYMLYGGLPRGRIVEFAGDEGSGKTTTALDIAANARKQFKEEWKNEIKELEAKKEKRKAEEVRLQYIKDRGPQQIVYADCENTLDEDWAELLGVKTEDMVVLKPMSQSAEQIFEMLLQMMETDEVGLVVIDSLGVMLSGQAYEKSMEEKTYGGIAASLTLFSKKAEMLCAKHNCTVIGINQMREDMNSPWGGQITTGGKAWKHNCFSGNTLFVSDRGLRRFRDCIDGEEVVVVDKDGELRQAVVHHYGEQQLQRVKLRTPNMNHELLCTSDHRWVLADGTTTENLKVGDKLYYRPENINHTIVTKRQADMFCLGMAIADGTDRRRQCKDGEVTDIKVVLCNDKEQYESLFIKAGYRKFKEGDNYCYVKNHTSKQSFLNGEGWKYLSAEDNRYLFEGYYAGDGHKTNDTTSCVTHDKRVLAFIEYTCNMAGYFITSIKKYITDEQSYKPGQEGYSIIFTTHTNKYNGWVVYQIEPTNYNAGTYCVEEPVTQTFTLEKGIVTGNCSVRLLFRKGDFLDEKGGNLKRSAETPMGNEVLVHIEKTKVCKPDRRVGFYTLMYHSGIDEIADTIETGLKYQLISQAGSWFNFVDITTGEILEDKDGQVIKLQGKGNLKEYLKENQKLYKEISSTINELISDTAN